MKSEDTTPFLLRSKPEIGLFGVFVSLMGRMSGEGKGRTAAVEETKAEK